MTEFKPGDRVKVTYEATIASGWDRGPFDLHDADGYAHTVYLAKNPDERHVHFEKLEKPFTDGDIVRDGDGDIFRVTGNRFVCIASPTGTCSVDDYPHTRDELTNPVVKLVPEGE